jgi:hypothetical protein
MLCFPRDIEIVLASVTESALFRKSTLVPALPILSNPICIRPSPGYSVALARLIHVPHWLPPKSVLTYHTIAGPRFIDGTETESMDKLDRQKPVVLFPVSAETRHVRSG